MRNNSKNRKLTIIRVKNKLRYRRIKLYATQKISNEYPYLTAQVLSCITTFPINIEDLRSRLSEPLSDEVKNAIEYWLLFINKAKKRFKKIYKIDLPIINVDTHIIDDDFIKNIYTNVVIFSKY